MCADHEPAVHIDSGVRADRRMPINPDIAALDQHLTIDTTSLPEREPLCADSNSTRISKTILAGYANPRPVAELYLASFNNDVGPDLHSFTDDERVSGYAASPGIFLGWHFCFLY
jgi:hypothetical protein